MTTRSSPHVTPSVRPITLGLVAGALLLGVADYVLNTVPGVGSDGVLRETFYVLRLDAEHTIPAWYSSSLLLFAAVACGAVWWRARGDRPRPHVFWLVLCVTCAFLSLDVSATIHERLGNRIGELFTVVSWRYGRWTLAYGPAVILFAAAAIPFLRSLVPWLRFRMLGCGALYVAAALGLEVVEAGLHTAGRGQGLGFLTVIAVEETLEMIAIALFVGTLLDLHCRGVRSATARPPEPLPAPVRLPRERRDPSVSSPAARSRR